jgi:hypothetical protein
MFTTSICGTSFRERLVEQLEKRKGRAEALPFLFLRSFVTNCLTKSK